jgi:hypothetical protein
MNQAQPAAGQPPSQIQAYLNDVAGRLRGVGRSDLVQSLKEAAEARRTAAANVVVVGETSRGKSSFVNALLGRPGLSPVDLDTTTGCCVVLHHAPQLQARVRMYETGEIRDIPIEDVEDWVTVDRNPDNERRVHAVLIGVDCPLLEGMSLVDTPGVGGLDSGHGALAAEAASTADALLFVVDANAPISGPELAFLSKAALQIENVALVLTKTDAYDEWRTMVRDDLRLAAEWDPRLKVVPLFPVSCTEALDPEDRDESGILDVQTHLVKSVATRTGVLRYANLLRVADSCLGELQWELAAHRAARMNTGAPAVLEKERERLNAVGAEGKTLMRQLEDGFRRLNLDRADALNRGMRDLRTSYDEKVGGLRGNDLAALPSQLISEVTALADRLTEDARDRLTSLCEDLVRQVDDAVPELGSLGQLEPQRLTEAVSLESPRQRSANRVERLSTLISFSSGRSIGSLLASLPVIAIGGTPFIIAGLGLGAVFAFHMHRGRNDVTRQNEFKTWMREQLAEAERQLNNDFSRAMIDIGHELRSLLGERIETRKADLSRAIREREAELAADSDARRNEVGIIQQRLDEINALRQRGAELRSGVLELSSAVSGP